MTRGELELLQARVALGLAFPEDLPDAAARALEAGLDSPSLRVLAGEVQPTADPAFSLLERALEELGFETLAGDDARLRVSRHWARQLSNGQISAYDAAHRIASECCSNDSNDRPWDPFFSLASEHEDYRQERDSNPQTYDGYIARCENEIRTAADRLLSSDGRVSVDEIKRMIACEFPNERVHAFDGPLADLEIAGREGGLGPLQIQIDPEEVTLFLGNHTHCHFEDDWEALEFLRRVLRDEVVVWSGLLMGGTRAASPRRFRLPGVREFVWSGPAPR